MKITTYFSLFVLAVIGSTLLLFSHHKLKLQILQHPLTVPGAPMSTEGGDDVNGRNNYELMRLRDPQSGQIPDHVRELELAFAHTLPNDEMTSSSERSLASSLWSSRGPYNVGGRTRALALDVTNDSIILAGTPSGGLFRSTNAGVSWTQTIAPGTIQNVSCIAQDLRPGRTNTWYYGSGEGYGTSASGGDAFFFGNGLYKSIDGGNSWNPVAATNANAPYKFGSNWDFVWDIATNPADTVNDVVYAAALGVIYQSMDGGTTWKAVVGTGGSSTFSCADVKVTPTGIVYGTLDSTESAKGIWRSPDGITFTNITPPNFPTSYGRIVIGVAPSDENQVYFLGSTPGFGAVDTNLSIQSIDWNSLWKYTYVSGDGSGAGGIWENRSANLPELQKPFNTFNSQGGYDLIVQVKPNDPNTVFIGGTNIFRSTDGFATSANISYMGGYQLGTNWPNVQSYPDHHPDQHAILFYQSDTSAMLNSNDGGLFRTSNYMGANTVWTTLNHGYLTTMFYTCAVDHATPGNNVIIGGAQDNGSWFTKSINASLPWQKPGGGDGSYCYVADNRSSYYFSIQEGKTSKVSLDTNGNVLSFARIDPIGGKGYLFVNPFTIDPNNNTIMYMAGWKNLWRNNNLAGIPMVNNWDSISTNWVEFPDTVPTANSGITALAVCKIPANRVYYGTDQKKLYRVDSANVGTPAAKDITGTATSGAAFPVGGYISCIAVDPRNGDNVLVVFSNYEVYSLYYTTNGGTTWSKAGGNLEPIVKGVDEGPSCRWASILPVSDGTVFLVATSTGVYATDTLTGTSTVWVEQGTSVIGNTVCDMIDTRPSDGLVVVATHGHGIYSTYITSKSAVASVKNNPANVFQLGNYPNPTNGQTTVKFVLPNESRAELTLYDATGKKVRVIGNGNFAAGEHLISLNTSDLSSGLYYYSLVAGENRVMRKMVCVK